MKKLLLVMILLMSPLMGQEKTEEEIKKEIQELSTELKVLQKQKVKFDLEKQHWFAVFTRIDGVIFQEFSSMLPVSTTGIELFLGSKIYFYGQLGFYFELGYNNKVAYQGGISGVFGIGGYLINNRDSETKKGWSLMLNGGISIKGAMFSYLYPDVTYKKDGDKPYSNFLEIGVEINLKGIYNFNKHMGIAIGPYIGYHGLGVNNFSFGIQTGLVF